MKSTTAQAALEPIDDAGKAELLLHPLRQRILSQAREASTAAEIARRLELSPQKVNYHVRTLVDAGFLAPAGEGRKRNLVEKRYRATARSYVLLPQILGEMSPGELSEADRFSASYLMRLCAQLQQELAVSIGRDAAGSEAVPTLSLEAEVRFDSAHQRAAFAAALGKAVTGVIGRHTGPACDSRGRPGPGRAFRLIVGCYPLPDTAAGSAPTVPDPGGDGSASELDAGSDVATTNQHDSQTRPR